MKKILLFAAAAMVSLSSCVQTEEVHTGNLNEIGFKSGVTRAPIEGTTFDAPIAVWSIWSNPANVGFVDYFNNTQFAKNTEGHWAATPAKYWPTSGDMQFLALHPVIAATATSDATTGFTKLTTDAVVDNTTAQDDILFSDLIKCTAPQTSAMPLLFHHALAQLNVSIKTVDTGAEVVVNSITVKGVNLKGTLNVSTTSEAAANADSYKTEAEWTNVATGDHNFVSTDTTLSTAVTPTDALLVMPGDQTQIVIEYTIDGKAQTYTHDLSTSSATWDMGYKYTYNYTISVYEILFDCTVDEWKPGTGADTTI